MEANSRFVSLGEPRLKGLAKAVRVFRVLGERAVVMVGLVQL
jgi:hypothetical protein